MIKKQKGKVFGNILIILGLIIIVFNAVNYFFKLWFNWPWLGVIGLVIVVIGLKILRISKEKKIQEVLKEKKSKEILKGKKYQDILKEKKK